jgi:putative intracellular protease/amidase
MSGKEGVPADFNSYQRFPPPMRTAVLIYDGFMQFEVVLACYFMRSKGDVVTVSLDGRPATSSEGFITQPHMPLAMLDLDSVDLFLVPGGDPKDILGNELLSETLQQLDRRGRTLGAICAGPVHLARAGLLRGRDFTSTATAVHPEDFAEGNFRPDLVVVDGNIVTALPHGYVDFALELGKLLKVFKDEDDYQETVAFFREFRLTG